MSRSEANPNPNPLTKPEVTGYNPDITFLPLELIRLPDNPHYLEATHPTLIKLRQATSQPVEVAILAEESVFTEALDLIAETLGGKIDPNEKTSSLISKKVVSDYKMKFTNSYQIQSPSCFPFPL